VEEGVGAWAKGEKGQEREILPGGIARKRGSRRRAVKVGKKYKVRETKEEFPQPQSGW